MPASSAQVEKARRFAELHEDPRLLVLPNAWDAGSARLIEAAGFGALGTTSAGIAYAQGLPDGEQIGRDEMIEVVAQIARAVDLPVTADVEGGYGPAEDDVAETVRATIAAGAIGCNLEDAARDGSGESLVPLELQVRRVAAAREVADAEGLPFFVNARTDVLLLGVGPEDERLDFAIERLRAYAEAGASGVFLPGPLTVEQVEAVVRAVAKPLNVLALPGMPSTAELERAGAARLSTGSGPMRATLALLRRVLTELREHGSYELMLADSIPVPEANDLYS